MRPIVGIFALQGAVTPHIPHLAALGAEAREVRRAEDLRGCAGLILPGGESSTMLKLIGTFGLREPLAEAFQRIPVWGICAGCILLAREVRHPAQWSFGCLDIAVERNAYGSQIQSHEDVVDGYPVAFIRAPVLRSVGEGVETLALHRENPAWVRQGRIMATTFHPELALNPPSPMHRAFLELVRQA
jgi:5'-phosphate synthase pdxT subunit